MAETQFLQQLQQFQRRYYQTVAVRLLSESLTILCGILAAVMALSRLQPIPVIWWWTPAIAVPGWIIIGWRRSARPLFAVACDIDVAYQLKERVATAFELIQRKHTDELISWQIKDAQDALAHVSISRVYTFRWWRWSWPLLPVVAMLGILSVVPLQYDPPVPLTAEHRAILEELAHLPTTESLRSEMDKTLDKIRRATTVDEAQQSLAKLRGTTENIGQAMTSKLVAQIDSLAISEDIQQRLLAMVEHAGQLPEEQMRALLQGIQELLPEEIAEQLISDLQSLDTEKRASNAIIAGIRQLQRELVDKAQFALNQDGSASGDTGSLNPTSETSEKVFAPGQALVLTNEADVDGSVTTPGSGQPNSEHPEMSPVDAVLVSQQEFAEAILKERIPKRYQKPIEMYLREIALLPEKSP